MNQQSQKQNNQESGFDETPETAAAEKSPAEKRAARLDEINRELLIFNADSNNDLEEVETKRNQEFENKMREMEMAEIPISEDTKKLIYKNMVDDLIEHAGKESERFDELKMERKHLEQDGLVADFLEKTENLQLDINMVELKNILSSHDVLNLDRQKNREKLGISDENHDSLWKKGGKDLVNVFGKLLRMELADSQYAEILADPTVDFAKAEKRDILGQAVDLEELSDAEFVGLGVEKIKDVIRDMSDDKDGKVFQGNFSNVLVSEKSPYVLKTMREMRDEQDTEKQQQSFFSYAIFKEAFGEEFLPKQAILESKANGTIYVLQERQNFKKSQVLKNATVDELIGGERFKEILKIKENKEKLERFLLGIENIYESHNFVLDVLGDNIFIKMGDNGELDIKLIDYGGWRNDENKWGDDLQVVRKFIEKLRNI